MNPQDQARRLSEEGDVMGALQIWAEMTASHPRSQDLLEYGLLLNQLYLFLDASMVFDRLCRHPDALDAELLAVAKLLSARARYREALPFTHRACAIKPGDVSYTILHASCLERVGDDAAAKALLKPLLQNHPDQARAVRLMAHIDRRKNRFSEARERMESFLRDFDSPEAWRVQVELAGVLDRMGDYDEAMRVLLESKATIREQADAFYPSWRSAAKRQWEATQGIDAYRLGGWSDGVGQLTPEIRLCLLAGFPRSGTTLLEQVIGTSPECVGTDETGILATQFRDPLILQADSAGEALAELESFDAEELSAGRAEYLRCTEEYIGESIHGRLLIEKEPLLTADLPVPLRLFPESKILMPLRDPRDVVVSFFFTIVPLSSASVGSISIEASCRYYAEVMRHWLHLRELLPPERWM
jgi:tetratricopeptide (TPR) repeat protein